MGIVEQLINMNTETISIPETHSKIRESDQSESETSDSEEEDVPLELKSEFVAALMGRKYEEALKLCNIILKFDASHELALQYRPLLEQAVESVESESDPRPIPSPVVLIRANLIVNQRRKMILPKHSNQRGFNLGKPVLSLILILFYLIS